MYVVEYQMASGEWRRLPETYPDPLTAERAAKATVAYWRVVRSATGELAVAGRPR